MYIDKSFQSSLLTTIRHHCQQCQQAERRSHRQVREGAHLQISGHQPRVGRSLREAVRDKRAGRARARRIADNERAEIGNAAVGRSGDRQVGTAPRTTRRSPRQGGLGKRATVLRGRKSAVGRSAGRAIGTADWTIDEAVGRWQMAPRSTRRSPRP